MSYRKMKGLEPFSQRRKILGSDYFDLECACEHIDVEGKKILSLQIINALKDYDFQN